jgi:TPR repeat protein
MVSQGYNYPEKGQIILRRKAEANEQKAKEAAAESQQVAQFLKDMLKGVGPSVALGRDTVMLREILDKTMDRIGNDLNAQPKVEADLRTTVGEVYLSLGTYPEGEQNLRRALEIRMNLHEGDTVALAETLDDLGMALAARQKPFEAIEMTRPALAIREKLLGSDSVEVARSLNHLGDQLEMAGKYEEAEMMIKRAIALQQKLHDDSGQLDLARSFNSLSYFLQREGKGQEALDFSLKALSIRRKMLGTQHPDYAASLQNLANNQRYLGDLAQAEKTYREVLALQKKLLGNSSAAVDGSLAYLVGILKRQGKLSEAFETYQEAAEQGDGFAQSRLGAMYAEGDCVVQDQVEALKWFRRAADQGNAFAEAWLGRMYLQGVVVPKDPSEGLKWYVKAAEQNFSFVYIVGSLYAKGLGTPKNMQEAVNWWRRGAEEGGEASQLALAWAYLHGDCVPQNSAEAAKWYHKAAEQLRSRMWVGKDAQTLNDYAWLLSTCELSEMRDGHAAIDLAEQAVALTARKDMEKLGTLAAACAEAGQFERAISIQREALNLAITDTDKQSGAVRLAKYMINQPWRDDGNDTKTADRFFPKNYW